MSSCARLSPPRCRGPARGGGPLPLGAPRGIYSGGGWLREARSGGYGVWVRTFFGICERGVAVAILCQPRGRAGGLPARWATYAYRQRS